MNSHRKLSLRLLNRCDGDVMMMVFPEVLTSRFGGLTVAVIYFHHKHLVSSIFAGDRHCFSGRNVTQSR